MADTVHINDLLQSLQPEGGQANPPGSVKLSDLQNSLADTPSNNTSNKRGGNSPTLSGMAMGMAKDALEGIGAGVANTAAGILSLPHKAFSAIPEAPEWLQKAGANAQYDEHGNPIAPSTAFQIGRGGEQGAEFFVPMSKVGKAAKVIEGASALAKTARAGVNILGNAAVSGGVEAAHGGTASDVKKAAGLGAVGGGISAAADMIPTVEKTGALFQRIAAKANKVPIDVTGPGNAALELKTAEERGGPAVAVINKFIKRVTDPTKGPITYEEARDFYSNATSLSAKEAMAAKPNTARLLGEFRKALDQSLTQAADHVGMGDDYTQAMTDYHKAARIRATIETAKKMAIKAGVAGATGAAGYGLYKEISQ